MKIGDLVVLSSRKTRKGYSWEQATGIVVDVALEDIAGHEIKVCIVNFGGQVYSFGLGELTVVSE